MVISLTASMRGPLLVCMLVAAFLAPSPIPLRYQASMSAFFNAANPGNVVRHSGDVSASFKRNSRLASRILAGRETSRQLGAFRCPSNENAQRYFETGTYRGAPGIEDQDNWARLFQDYMGVPYSSEWETETWNYKLVYPRNNTAQTSAPSHYVMYHWHRYTDYTPAFSGNDEHLLFSAPLNGNAMHAKNPYTEWVKMDAGVGMATEWTNRWRSDASSGGGGPQFGCPSMETSFQLVAYKGRDLRAHNYHWVLWREVMQDGVIYASVRWIQVTDACKDDYTACPPFDPIDGGLFGTRDKPQYSTRMFVKTSSPSTKDHLHQPSLSFEDERFLSEIRQFTDTKIYVHEYYNRTTLTRSFAGFGYDGHRAGAPARHSQPEAANAEV